jgi:hypothetical protein
VSDECVGEARDMLGVREKEVVRKDESIPIPLASPRELVRTCHRQAV